MPNKPIEELLAGALAGDRKSQGELARRVLQPAIEAVVSRFLLGARRWQHAVDDLSHDVLIHFVKDDWARLRRYDPARGSLSTYIQAVTRHFLIDFFDRRPPPEPTELEEHSLAPDSGPERKADLGRQIERLADALSDDEYLLFRLAFLEDVARPEIARRFQVSLDALHRRIQRLQARAIEILSSSD